MTMTNADTASDQMRFQCDGRAKDLFWLTFRTTLLSFITLGVYRFWMRTHLRRWYWSHFKLGGESFVYTGTGLEKFLGFLLALVVLAVLLGLGQLLATFAGFGFGHPAGYFLAALVVVPLMPFAQYRARRYILSRTTWRGVRFGQGPGAGGYVLRWIGYTLLAVLSLGLLTPLAQFKLEKYLTDRSFYGDLAFRQEGRWTGLWRIWALIWLGAALLIGAVTALIVQQATSGGAPEPVTLVIAQMAVFLTTPLLMLFYQVRAFNYLTSHKATANGARFGAAVKTRSVLWVILRFALAVLAIYLVLGAVALAVMYAVFGGISDLPEPANAAVAGAEWAILLIIPAALALFALVSAFAQAFLSLPLTARYLEAVTADQASSLLNARQRAREGAGAADGFADALDVDIGGAF